jgi:hypothetical protein
MRDINCQAYLLHGELGQARQNFPSIAIFIEPRWQVRWMPNPQCLSLPCLSYRPPSFGNRAVSGDATQFCLIEKIFSIHGRNAFRAIQRAGCDICSTQRTTGVCLGDHRNICDQISVLRQAAPSLGQPSWKECRPRLLRSVLPDNLSRLLLKLLCAMPLPSRKAALQTDPIRRQFPLACSKNYSLGSGPRFVQSNK